MERDNIWQDEIGNVKPESESTGQHSGIEDTRGIDRLESRYEGDYFSPRCSMDGWSAIKGRLFCALFRFDEPETDAVRMNDRQQWIERTRDGNRRCRGSWGKGLFKQATDPAS